MDAPQETPKETQPPAPPQPLEIKTEVHLRFKVDGRLNPAEQGLLIETVKQLVAGYSETRHVVALKLPKQWSDQDCIAFMERVMALYKEAVG